MAKPSHAMNGEKSGMLSARRYELTAINKNTSMNIRDLVSIGGNVQVVVSAADLKEFFEDLQEERKTASLPQQQETNLTLEEVLAILHITKSTIWRWGKQGYLVPIRVGRRKFYKKSDIDKLLDEGR